MCGLIKKSAYQPEENSKVSDKNHDSGDLKIRVASYGGAIDPQSIETAPLYVPQKVFFTH